MCALLCLVQLLQSNQATLGISLTHADQPNSTWSIIQTYCNPYWNLHFFLYLIFQWKEANEFVLHLFMFLRHGRYFFFLVLWFWLWCLPLPSPESLLALSSENTQSYPIKKFLRSRNSDGLEEKKRFIDTFITRISQLHSSSDCLFKIWLFYKARSKVLLFESAGLPNAVHELQQFTGVSTVFSTTKINDCENQRIETKLDWNKSFYIPPASSQIMVWRVLVNYKTQPIA